MNGGGLRTVEERKEKGEKAPPRRITLTVPRFRLRCANQIVIDDGQEEREKLLLRSVTTSYLSSREKLPLSR